MKKQRINQIVTKPKSPNQSLVRKLSQQKRNLNQSPIAKKRAIKLDLKLQYLNNEIYEKKKFRQFLQEINLQTKRLIKNEDMLNDKEIGYEKLNKRRNSFNLNVETFKNTLVAKDNKKAEQTIKQEDTTNYYDFKPSKINFVKLNLIKQKISEKVVSVNNQISQIKKKLLSSSIWQDKQFYDFTQQNYEIKTQDIEERLEKSENNLQQKQRMKKQIVSTGLVNKGQNVKVIKFGQYQVGSEQGIIVSNYVGIKKRLMNEFSKINRIYKRIGDISQQSGQFVGYMRQQSRQQNSQVEGIIFAIQTSHGWIKAGGQVIRQISNIIEGIKQKNKTRLQLLVKNNKLNKIGNIDIRKRKQVRGQDKIQMRQQLLIRQQSVQQLIYSKIGGINRQILKRQLYKTKNRINELKYQTQLIQNSIKQLQAYKALTILRNNNICNLNNNHKNHQNNYHNNHNNHKNNNNNKNSNNNKYIRQSKKNNFNDQILRLILEQQLLNKILSLQIQNKFSTIIFKQNTNSYSHTQLSSNYHQHINTINKYHSLNHIYSIHHSSYTQSQSINQIQSHKNKSIIKKNGIQIITPQIIIKQITSSAQTNP